MKSIVFDTSTLISLATNNLLWTLGPLKNNFSGELYIAGGVKEELIDRPLESVRFKLEAMQVLSILGKGIIKINSSNEIVSKSNYLISLANNSFKAKNNWINIVHKGEMQALALAISLKAEAYAVDERTTRILVENPKKLASLLHSKLHTNVYINNNNLERFKKEVSGVNIIRSAELMVAAYNLGILDEYLDPAEKKIVNINLNKYLLEGLLWALKLKGCAISIEEIKQIMKAKGF